MSTVPEQVMGFYDLPQAERNVWMARYGASAPYFWASQAGLLEVPPAAQGFYGLPEHEQATWYGEYGAGAAQEWANQAGQAGQPGAPELPTAGGPGAGAGALTSNRPAGWSPMTPSGLTGFTDFGRSALNILPDYIPHLNDPKLAPGYLPSSGTFNQFRLDQPGLFGTLPGQQGVVNLRYGLGGPGDPTTGGEVQTPQRWVTGNMADSAVAERGDARWRASGGTWRGGGMGGGEGGGWSPVSPGVDVWQPGAAGGGGGGGGMGGGFFSAGPGYDPSQIGNWDKAPQTQGLDSLITLFMRPDTPTGINTAAWSAPQQYWDLLVDAIRRGIVVVNSPDAWAMLAQKNPAYTPKNIGGAALTNPVQPGGGTGTPGVGTPGSDNGLTNYYAQMAAVQQANQAMQQAYSEWTMATGDEKLAMEKAQQAWSQKYQEAQQAWNQQYQTAGLTGQLNGQDTLAKQQQLWSQGFQEQQMGQQGALSLLQLQSQLQGPRDVFRYWQMAGSTPQGLQSALSSLAGNYNIAGSNYQGTPGGATLESRVGDLTSNAQGQAAPANPNNYALRSPNQWNLANWAAMSPSQQQGVLGLAEAQGYYGDDVLKQLQNAAPRYSGPSGGTVRMA